MCCPHDAPAQIFIVCSLLSTGGIAGMGSATIFFWLQLPNVRKKYRTALIITGLVTSRGVHGHQCQSDDCCMAGRVGFG